MLFFNLEKGSRQFGIVIHSHAHIIEGNGGEKMEKKGKKEGEEELDNDTKPAEESVEAIDGEELDKRVEKIIRKSIVENEWVYRDLVDR